MPSNLETRVWRLEGLIQPLRDALRQLRDQIANLRQQQYGIGGGGGGSGGGGGGAYQADHLNILAGTTGTGITVKRTWDGTTDTTSGLVRNTGPDDTNNTRRQYLIKNPDNSYTIVGQSCLAV